MSKKSNEIMIRDCVNLKEDLIELNSIMNVSQVSFQPWLLACYIIGFEGRGDGDYIKRRNFLHL